MAHWDDLKIFLAVARKRKLARAAIALGMDETTVSRRLKRLENDMGQTLFERLRTGHILTSYGEKILTEIEQIESHAQGLFFNNLQKEQQYGGKIRISVAEGFGAYVIAPILKGFTSKYNQIEIDLVSGSGFLSLSRREADISISLTRSKSKNILSEKLCDYTLRLYASPDYLASKPAITGLDDLADHDFIDYVDDLVYSDELRYFETYLKDITPKYRSTSIIAQKQFTEAGMGLAILPDFLAAGPLVPVLDETLLIERSFWFSIHQSFARLDKFKAFKTYIQDAVPDRIEGTPNA